MRNLPSSTITLLFTDIEGSTRLLGRLGERYSEVLAECRHLLRGVFEHWHSHEVDTQGDAFFVVFARAAEAVSAAVEAQRALAAHAWPEGIEVGVRMGLHTGEPSPTAEGYVGVDVHHAARIMSAGHGGQVLLSRATRELVEHTLPDGVALRDMGKHRLKDLQRPSHLFQLVIAGLPSDFPPLNTLNTRPNNLPFQPTPFIGREMQVAAELSDLFADGISFVDLAPLNDPALVIAAIAQSLGIREVSGQPLLERLKDELQRKQMLLLLDNFEQVVSAAVQVADLLATYPLLKVLVTSRVVLHVQAEHEFFVPSLSLPDPNHVPDLAALSQYEAVALFLRRAQSARSDFHVTNANAPAVAEICVRLDGLPLAIELAAARMKLLSPEALLVRLHQPLHVLTSGPRDVVARQQTLRNTIEWSYQLLNAQEQQLFRRLSVFVCGGPLSAIEATSLGSEAESVLDTVASLADNSLLQRVEQQAGEEPRFAMLETIREYALESLEALGETEAARGAHAAYFLRLAEEAEQGMAGPQQAVLLERLEQEHDNLRAAMQWSLEQAEEGKAMALRLGGALYSFWFVRAYFSEGRDFLERELSRGDEVAAPVRAKALYAASQLHDALGSLDQAEEFYEQSLALYRELGDTRGIASCLHLLADIAWGRANLALARSQGEESLMLFRELDDKRSVAYLLYHLGSLAVEQGEYARGRDLLTESLMINRELGDTRIIALSLFNLALLYRLSGGNLAQANTWLDESFALSRELGDKESIANCLSLSGMLAHSEGDAASARSLTEQALAIFKEMKQQHGTALSLYALAEVAAAGGDSARSQALYEQGVGVARKSGDKRTIPSGLEGLAVAIAAQGNHAWAAHLWGAAETLREAIGAPMPPVECAPYHRAVAAARTQFGEKAFATAWAEGRMMSPDHVLATQGELSSSPATASPAPYPDGLTTREVEVLRVVAQGLTNEQVAERLVISPRTVDTHLTLIYSKIGVSSRSAATRYAIEHHLV